MRTYNNKLIETMFPEYREILLTCTARKPDVVSVDAVRKDINIIEVTICYDVYFELAQNTKLEKYSPLKNVLLQLGYEVNVYIPCFGSLGTEMKDCSRNIRKLSKSREKTKGILNGVRSHVLSELIIYGETE